MSELHFIIKSDGTVEIDAQGFSGTKCLETSQPYEKDLGLKLSQKKKPEILGGGDVKLNGSNRNRIGY